MFVTQIIVLKLS